MSFVDGTQRQIQCKVVYCGPSLAGKTTNLRQLYERTSHEHRGQLVRLATETERTVFFDFLPLSLGELHGFDTRLHLYTVPGQALYEASRSQILEGADGVVFVADSGRDQLVANLEAMRSLTLELGRSGRSLEQMPLVLQYNKRDSRGAVAIEELQQAMNHANRPYVEAIASRGEGVSATLKAIARLTLLATRELALNVSEQGHASGAASKHC